MDLRFQLYSQYIHPTFGHVPLLRFLLPLPEPDALQLAPHLAAVQEPDTRGPHSDQVTSHKPVTVS